MFELLSQKNNKRVGLLKTKSGVIKTPFFMPIATKGAVKNMTPEDLREIGAQIVLGNTYHLWLRPGDELISRAGGLHKFMNWNGPILTDSGGYQVFSLGARAKDKYGSSGVVLSERGVEFADPVNGSRHFMSPEKSIEIQLNLGSDMIMVLDECPPYPASHEYTKKSLELTTRWAARCFEYFHKRIAENPEKYANGRPLLFCIVQGGIYEDLRKESARQLGAIDFVSLGGPSSGWDGWAIGGVAVGEPRKHLYEILDWVVPLLPKDKPRYLMGLGKPEELAKAVEAGMDMFDCVIPTREGRHGRLFCWRKTSNFQPCLPAGRFPISNDQMSNKEKGNTSTDDCFYETINISNNQFTEDFTAVDENCDCYTCRNYTKAYLHHLLRTNEPLFLKLASVHNLRFYHELMEFLEET
ncbi:MAG: Queuine tRNA-ribosyltransferase [Candidatus Moranbacteria bacterium GW2011_GWC2_37_8]|nr:MAG: Queuine tRNA-ribosyltransferase [Candidatus Moranbacteria bacterium GW2011_GWC2_37_8]KKQ61091.1 MAG: Queuine tRNA-ribosyltransferase [Parcubacteria group bacterium GW2011_GWC1_38_22]